MKIRKLVFPVLMALCLTACNDSVEEGQKGTVLVLATFDNSRYLQKQVAKYNEIQQEYQIEIQKYERSDQAEEDGILLLQRQIASGEGPDIIDFGESYTTSDIVGAYTEDLFPYMEAESGLTCVENILQAFSYQDKLYAVPLGFQLKSFVGTEQNLGEKSSWTINEMMECYSVQKDKLLYPGAYKKDVLGTILTGSMDYYIDWETGECKFDGSEFRQMLMFCNSFADQLDFTEESSIRTLFLEDKALLLPISINSVYDICRVETIFGENDVNFIGFPVNGTCGTMIQSSGPVLAVNRNSRNKAESWNFLSWMLQDSAERDLPSGFPICRKTLEEQVKQAEQVEYEKDVDGNRRQKAKDQIILEGEEPIDIYCITEEQAEKLLTLIEEADAISQVDPKIYQIFLEEADYYFNGAKSLDETVDVIQSKIYLYVNEKIS